MLVDHYESEDVFARVPRMAERIDPVLKQLDRLLDDDELYRASCGPTSASGVALPWCMGDTRHLWR